MANKSRVSAAQKAMRKAQAIIAWRAAYYPDVNESDGPWLEHLTKDDMSCPPDGDVLNFAGLGLTSLPPELADVDGVGFVFLQSNNLKSIDAGLLLGMGLTSLDLSGNPLKLVPEALFQITSLLDLYIVDTPLSTLPVPTADVSHLAMLNLANNPKLKLPAGFLERFTQLKSLCLDGYSSTDFPDEILQLKTLKQLSLDRTKFSQLPSAIAELKSLGQLSLDDAQLTSLPKSLAAHDQLAQSASKLNFMGIKMANNPFADKALRKIAKLKNPDRTVQALAWAGEHGSAGR